MVTFQWLRLRICVFSTGAYICSTPSGSGGKRLSPVGCARLELPIEEATVQPLDSEQGDRRRPTRRAGACDDRQARGLDKREDSTNELLTLEVGKLTQLNRATQMRGVKCIASRTAKWTLLRNLNGD